MHAKHQRAHRAKVHIWKWKIARTIARSIYTGTEIMFSLVAYVCEIWRNLDMDSTDDRERMLRSPAAKRLDIQFSWCVGYCDIHLQLRMVSAIKIYFFRLLAAHFMRDERERKWWEVQQNFSIDKNDINARSAFSGDTKSYLSKEKFNKTSVRTCGNWILFKVSSDATINFAFLQWTMGERQINYFFLPSFATGILPNFPMKTLLLNLHGS